MSKKLLIAVIAILAIGTTMASATESRVETLGAQGIYHSDDTGQNGNPSLVTDNPKMLRIHLGGIAGDANAYGGANLTPIENLTIGIYAGNGLNLGEGGISYATTDAIDFGLSQFQDPFAVGIADEAVDWMNPFNLILGYKMGDLSVGISYGLANGKYSYNDEIPFDPSLAAIDEDDTETIEAKARLHSVKLGIAYKADNIEPQVWFHYNPFSITGTYEYEDNASGLGDNDFSSETQLKGRKFVLGGRVFWGLNDNLTLVPAVNWELTKGAVTWDTDDDNNLGPDTTEEDLDVNYSVTDILGGIGLNYKADKLFVVSSASVKYSKYIRNQAIDTDDYDNVEVTDIEKDFAVPDLALGIEYKALDWMLIRSGIHTTAVWATHRNLSEDNYDVADPTIDTDEVYTVQSTMASVGLGLLFGNLTIDGTLGNSFLSSEDGGSEGNLFSNLDVKYVF